MCLKDRYQQGKKNMEIRKEPLTLSYSAGCPKFILTENDLKIFKVQ